MMLQHYTRKDGDIMTIDAIKNNYAFSVDDYGKLKVLNEKDSIVDMILMLILGTEYQFGTIQRKSGFNIRNYRFKFIDDSIIEIQQGIKELIEDMIPGSLIEEVVVVKQGDDTIVIGLEFLPEIAGYNDDRDLEIEEYMAVVRLTEREDGYDIQII